jgi:hypothetical protein
MVIDFQEPLIENIDYAWIASNEIRGWNGTRRPAMSGVMTRGRMGKGEMATGTGT